MMFGPRITITIDGPGGCVNYDAEIIRMALALVGYTVQVDNDYPIEQEAENQNMTVDQYMKWVSERNTSMPKIKMVVNNLPWGG